ncbi:hypothetical protein DUNSADRAFT_1027 [Dunaliella salina]|uniref:Polymerase nucleotidyl transferase domain-containing protein n=1 Tax=Dunaliella salina TaxID=3046 RepID=A0ABQ7GXR5_DUNSA|nr:hypothetical protein DUNSADRAFT_1027 [Dunaliella salina]|eukprot:KAF5839343.1 hypothetical protein DUNSADRAFT_1027 [Dunaliella salina]
MQHLRILARTNVPAGLSRASSSLSRQCSTICSSSSSSCTGSLGGRDSSPLLASTFPESATSAMTSPSFPTTPFASPHLALCNNSWGSSTKQPHLPSSRHAQAGLHARHARHLSSMQAVQQFSATTGGPSSSSSSSPGNFLPGSQQPQVPPRRIKYSPLHYDIEDFCRKVVPTDEERKLKLQVIDIVRSCASRAFADVRDVDVEVFGSFANGLSTWSSDVDVCVTGLMAPDRVTGCYDVKERGKVTVRLRKIGDYLRRHKKLEHPQITVIPKARIPIIKLRARSVQARALPPMRALVLVLKCYLKSLGLNEVATGGLSSYSLCNMVIAHLQEELKAGRDIYDLGESLYAFLLRYGEEFDYETEAVSVASGGIVSKRALGFAMKSARFAAAAASYDDAVPWYERLCVDCPLSGRDVSNGTFRIDSARSAFVRAARKLEALARGRRGDGSINYLSALFEVDRITTRTKRPLALMEDEELADPWEGGECCTPG